MTSCIDISAAFASRVSFSNGHKSALPDQHHSFRYNSNEHLAKLSFNYRVVEKSKYSSGTPMLQQSLNMLKIVPKKSHFLSKASQTGNMVQSVAVDANTTLVSLSRLMQIKT